MFVNSFKNITFLRTLLLRSLRKGLSRTPCRRHLLSPAYQCTDAWNQQLRGPLFKDLDLDDFFVEMDKKFKANKKVSALDVDLFVNSINSDDRFEELDHILYSFRRTRSTVRTLESTHHAVARLLVKYGRHELLLKVLKDRIGYGIFPDHFAMNLVMDALIEKGNFKDASRVASFLMLQEDLDHPVTKVLALYACHMHLREKDSQPWHDPAPVVQEDDDEDEVLVRVPYLRNPYFDDHFDLTLREHLLGKTLYYATKGMNDVVGRSYAAVGLALYEKWEQVATLLEKYCDSKETILKESASFIQSLLTLTEDKQINSEKDVESSSSDSSAKTDNGFSTRISSCLASLENAGLIVDGNLHELLSAIIETLPQLEKEDIGAMTSLFQEWEKNRDSELKREMALVSLREAQLSVSMKKKELKDKEEVLYFFENEDKYMMELADAEKESNEKAGVTVLEEEYIVPEIPRKTISVRSNKVHKTKTSLSV